MPVSADGDASSSSASIAVASLRSASERSDAEAVRELLAPDVVFHSPLTDRIHFQGRDEVAALHRDIFAVLVDLETADPLASGDTGAFSFSARVRGSELEAVVLVRVNDQGQIDDLKVFLRPLPSVGMLMSVLPPRVSSRQRGPLWGRLAALLTWPLAFALRTADRFVPRFVRPS